LPLREPREVSWGHTQFFRAVPSANTLVRWGDENAFASIVQARPFPTLGRPVRHGIAASATARHFSASLSDSVSRRTPCPPVAIFGGMPTQVRPLGCIRRFQLRARVGFSMSAHSGRRGITPAFGYDAPHPGVRGTSTLLTWALPSTHYEVIRLPMSASSACLLSVVGTLFRPWKRT